MGRESDTTGGEADRLLQLYDAAHEEGLEAWHIEAWLLFEHEMLRLNLCVEIGRRDLERIVSCPECSRKWRARGMSEGGVWRAIRGDLDCSECGSCGEVLR